MLPSGSWIEPAQHSGTAIDVCSLGRAESGLIPLGICTSLASGSLADLLSAYVVANSTIRPDFLEGGRWHVAAVQRHEPDVAFLAASLLRFLWP